MLSYRAILIASFISLITCTQHVIANNPTQAQQVAFSWRVSGAHQNIVKKTLKFDGTIKPDEDAKGAIYLFVGVAMLPSLVDAILNLRAKLVRPGIIIDTREREIKIETSSTLPAGSILLVDKNGSSLMEKGEIPNPVGLESAIESALRK